jgi:serine kinase of HPr protein (carbohydrate metabolism regulator)
MELRLLGPVLSYWLERLGIPVLHAAAVRMGEGAVGFVAHSGGGKSSLAAALLQAGAPLLTDDLLPVEEEGGTFLARPGLPQMRLEPDTARFFLGRTEGLIPVSPDDSKLHVPVDAFCDTAVPLTGLYLVERRPGPLEILPLSKAQAVIELVRHSFSPYLVEAAGLQPRRLDLFTRLVRQVPVRRLLCPEGLEHLPRAVGALC